MIFWTQRHTASLRRRDGHTIDGIPGDCLRASVATVMGLSYDDVWHFAQHRSWWATMRLHAARYGLDWTVQDLEDLAVPYGQFAIACGPSPRGSFGHAVVADHCGRVVHDPHPSRAGLLGITEYLVLVKADPKYPVVLRQLTNGL